MSYLLWQLIDSGFPAGGFAHSAGLEASVQHGHVKGAEDVYAFARRSVLQAGRGALPVMTAAHRGPAMLPSLDRFIDVFLSNPVANRASRAQGRALFAGVDRSLASAAIDEIRDHVARPDACAHYAPMFGAILRQLDVALIDAQRAFLFMTARGVTTAAVRLGLLGAYQAQDAQACLAPDIDRTIETCGELAASEIAQTSPLADLFQSTHDRLYSRLFQS